MYIKHYIYIHILYILYMYILYMLRQKFTYDTQSAHEDHTGFAAKYQFRTASGEVHTLFRC